MSLADVCWNISSVFIVITLGVIAILCVLMLLGVFVCIFDHDDTTGTIRAVRNNNGYERE